MLGARRAVLFVALVVGVAAVDEGCSSSSAQPAPAPAVLDGRYVASGGSVSEMTFVDGVRYSLWRSPCAFGSGSQCLEHGTYTVDATSTTLALIDDVSGRISALPFSVTSEGVAATPSSADELHTLGGVSLGGSSGDGGVGLTEGDAGCLTVGGEGGATSLTSTAPAPVAVTSGAVVAFTSGGTSFKQASAVAPSSDGAALARGEVAYTYSGMLSTARSALTVGATLGGSFSLPIPRYIGAFSQTGGGGRSLGDYVKLHRLGKYTEMIFEVANTEGIALQLMVQNLQTGNGWKPVLSYDPDAATGASAGHPVVVPAAPSGPASKVRVYFPTEQLALAPSMGSTGANAFKLVVSALGCNPGAAAANATLTSATVDFFAEAPVVLVHGINDDQANCWQSYAPFLTSAGFIADMNVSFVGLADKGAGCNGSVVQDVGRIQQRLARLVHDYGTADVHLVGHSKGGLDLVNFLVSDYPAMKSAGTLRVLSLQTLSSPHGGSVEADINEPLKVWSAEQGYSLVSGEAEWSYTVSGSTSVLDTLALEGIKAAVLSNSGPIDPGLSDLRTSSAAVAADLAWSGDPDIYFAAYGWDADFNRTQWVNALGASTSAPASTTANAAASLVSRKYSMDCRGAPIGSDAWSELCIDETEVDAFFTGTGALSEAACINSATTCGAPLWRPMANGQSASVSSAANAHIGSTSTITFNSYPNGEWVGNDLVVALPSASHPSAMSVYAMAGTNPRSMGGLYRLAGGGGVQAYTAACSQTGSNHIALLRASKSNMVECTGADTIAWLTASAPVEDVPNPQ